MMPTAPNATARARRSFWALVLIAALATGALSTALKAHPSPAAGAAAALSGAVLAISLTLATRILLALDHARRTTRPPRRRRLRQPPRASDRS